MITLLQHTHPALPHYADKDWEWLRGALSTVDRSYGPLDYVFHHIADTHVAHHLFSTMPHYHAKVRDMHVTASRPNHVLRTSATTHVVHLFSACHIVSPRCYNFQIWHFYLKDDKAIIQQFCLLKKIESGFLPHSCCQRQPLPINSVNSMCTRNTVIIPIRD